VTTAWMQKESCEAEQSQMVLLGIVCKACQLRLWVMETVGVRRKRKQLT